MLTDGGLFSAAMPFLTTARNLIAQAQFSNDTEHRRSLVREANSELGNARGAIVV